jgi:hypothetical protein
MALFQKIQLRLLLNHPLLFSARVVPALITGLSVNAILFLYFLLSPTQTESNSGIVGWTAFLVLCTIISIIIYLVFLFRFNLFKVFGKKTFFQFFLQGLYIFLSISSFIAWPFIPRLASSLAISKSHSAEQIASDFEKAHITAYRMEYDNQSAPYRIIYIKIDTLQNDSVTEDYANNLMTVKSAGCIPANRFLYTEKTSETSYQAYEKQNLACSDFSYQLSFSSDFSDKIYRSLKDEKMNREQGEAILNAIFAKYIKNYNGKIFAKDAEIQFAIAGAAYVETSPVCNKYRLSEMSAAMEKIHNRIATPEELSVLVRVWFYMSLYLSLFFLIFRYMTVRTFLWSLLTAFLLFVFTVIISIITEPGESGVLGILLFYYFISLALAITIFFSKTRHVFSGIGLNLSFFFLPLAPFLIHAYIFSQLPEGHYLMEQKGGLMFFTEFMANTLLIVSCLFFHSALYYRWYSLPEE